MVPRKVNIAREIHEGSGSSGRFLLTDVLQGLDALLETHAEKIKLIYLDPPFQTGEKFVMRVRVGEHEEVLHEGDSIFYKSSTPHGMIAVEGKDCVFLAMIMAGSETEQAMVVAPRKLPEPETVPAAEG